MQLPTPIIEGTSEKHINTWLVVAEEYTEIGTKEVKQGIRVSNGLKFLQYALKYANRVTERTVPSDDLHSRACAVKKAVNEALNTLPEAYKSPVGRRVLQAIEG